MITHLMTQDELVAAIKGKNYNAVDCIAVESIPRGVRKKGLQIAVYRGKRSPDLICYSEIDYSTSSDAEAEEYRQDCEDVYNYVRDKCRRPLMRKRFGLLSF